MKFRAHDTFSIRKGWLHKGMRHIINNPRVFVDKNINSMDEFGLGANMVKALRYWLQATGLTIEATNNNNRSQQLSPFGRIVWENDSYLEEDGTLFLIHYFLSTNKDLATAWYYFFNEYNMIEISPESFINGIRTFLLKNNDFQVSERALKDDFDCIIKTYLETEKNNTPENNMSCPLSELGLISSSDIKNKIYVKSTPNLSSINPLIILAIIINENEKSDGTNEIKISKLESDPCNIGKVFNLDTFAIASYLDKLQNFGYIKINRTAGLDLIYINTQWSFLECIEEYYRSIND